MIAAAQEETGLADNIRTIESSPFAPERKAGIISRKKHQLGILEETRAMAYYEVAVGYLHAGRKEQALDLAKKAAAHLQFKEAAEQLITHIK